MAVATFGGGCFWGVEYFFRQVPGVLNATSGYMGGDDRINRYEEVKQGNSGHAEVVLVEFDEARVSFTELLQVFWSNHNPTSLNRQGGDIGTQYRSVIFFHSKEQKEQAEASKLALARSGKWGQRHIVTEIIPVKQFHPAEKYHQDYIQKNNLPSCHLEY
ncbi:peptide-methionine (S)-S-oxide reductase MsrA [Shewanella algae]|uniref:peptide-methionine (S)-S-oxide reductase MsrA n=1 Tax=Shewanella algae TaxID=38313 RepID=UPI001AAE0C4A|nr:peptide-methionine (S)-S-oxide reductase MsrA [Shewanella algae]MBO2616248.1 peptide-methionine (S)-S-oxide reductase MsrA [Shewanella algae]QTE88544.1 peptide-methionine (S)-S-oxide reductase MsrA [Shewanella algae]